MFTYMLLHECYKNIIVHKDLWARDLPLPIFSHFPLLFAQQNMIIGFSHVKLVSSILKELLVSQK